MPNRTYCGPLRGHSWDTERGKPYPLLPTLTTPRAWGWKSGGHPSIQGKARLHGVYTSPHCTAGCWSPERQTAQSHRILFLLLQQSPWETIISLLWNECKVKCFTDTEIGGLFRVLKGKAALLSCHSEVTCSAHPNTQVYLCSTTSCSGHSLSS